MSFDIRTYTENVHPVRDDDIDYDSFTSDPLSPETLRALQYFSDIETHTVCYLRDLLVTPSHRDPEITAFLTMWNFEEYWHGEVLGRVLRAHGIDMDSDHIRARREAQGTGDKMSPIYQALAANIIGEDFMAVHMAFGAVNEWSTHVAYGRMIARETNPELVKLLGRIQQQESHHLAFYAYQARMRLEHNRRAQKITRFVLKTWWTPVGSSVMPYEETCFVQNYLLGGPEGNKLLGYLDDKVERLPGLQGMNLVSKGVGAFGVGPYAADPKAGRATRLILAVKQSRSHLRDAQGAARRVAVAGARRGQALGSGRLPVG